MRWADRAGPGFPATWTRPGEAVRLLLCGRTAGPVSVVVGTLLSAVNQGAVIGAGQADTGTWVRVAVNYLVPFLVASFGYLSARRVPAVLSPVPQRGRFGAAWRVSEASQGWGTSNRSRRSC
ncbi:nitrate/nitrite transporter NrtS [Streptomyces sp. H10-C2]|uniref:nitrate/nitrite transporter NrtS n=1 Tax=unclassified Streptomyces TaxID=2593676 RepID=UPI0024B9B6F2|nr:MULTISPECIES: nitrate/nitrite transporter NrtS [unclassified Streptomyces]MDJ0346602.1 nitrate/nitrite transporter NrtS [Streptomyces sp. PH10-H1]MDJ0375025.1 nitrate/nitrite transporter NrtS [Streptomyces sp. H10-C2]